MRALPSLTFALVLAVAGLPALAQEPISNLPRTQTLIVENPEGTIKNAG
jgi:peptide/nickel transport system substrate-binding protein